MKNISFKDQVKEWEVLFDEIHTMKIKLKNLKECLINSFLINDNFSAALNKAKKEYIDLENIFDNKTNRLEELYPGNFRNVIYSLAKEENITLDELAIKLNLQNKYVLKNLCCGPSYNIDEKSYLKVCKYFNLNEKNRWYRKYKT